MPKSRPPSWMRWASRMKCTEQVQPRNSCWWPTIGLPTFLFWNVDNHVIMFCFSGVHKVGSVWRVTIQCLCSLKLIVRYWTGLAQMVLYLVMVKTCLFISMFSSRESHNATSRSTATTESDSVIFADSSDPPKVSLLLLVCNLHLACVNHLNLCSVLFDIFFDKENLLNILKCDGSEFSPVTARDLFHSRVYLFSIEWLEVIQ